MMTMYGCDCVMFHNKTGFHTGTAHSDVMFTTTLYEAISLYAIIQHVIIHLHVPCRGSSDQMPSIVTS